MKTCFKCGRALPLGEFYRHPMMADGHLGKCKECAKRDVTTNRLRRLAEIREYDRERNKLPKRRADRYRRAKVYFEKHPERRRAIVRANNAVRDGRLIRQVCEVCGSERSEKHHDDYSKPLEVRWLCKPHHYIADRQRRVL